MLGGIAAVTVGSACAAGDTADGAGGTSNTGGFGNVVNSGGSVWGDGSAAGGAGGTGAVGGSGGLGAFGGTGGDGGTAATGGGGTTGGTGGVAGASGGGGAAGSGGSAGDAGPTWPLCDVKPSSVPSKTINQVWVDNPTQETQVWISGAYVAAVSGSGCTSGSSCQIFIQSATSYANLGAAAKNGINVRVAGSVAQHFTGIAVGDQVDVMGWAWRSTLGGASEMVVQVNSSLPGCAKKVGAGTLTPVAAQLSDLTVNAYEQTHGPMLVQLSTITGKPAGTKEIFGLWTTGVGIGDAGPEGLVNVSPYFLANNAFTGLPTDGQTAVDFTSVSGVFAVFVPFTEAGTPPKYVVVYPRTVSELVKK